MAKRMRTVCLAAALGVFWLALPLQATAQKGQLVNRTLCLFDFMGANGDSYAMGKDLAAAALGWGVHLNLRAYTDEGVAFEDFKAHKCDAAGLTGIRVRLLHKFAGSLLMMGALPSYAEAKTAAMAILQPKAAPLMTEGPYEVMSVMPFGAVYIFARDRSWNSLKDVAGKRLAVIGWDRQATAMAEFVGVSLVAADFTNFVTMFNNGSVDAIYGPALIYDALEAYKGIGTTGGVADYPIAQGFFEVIAYKDRFPEGFGQKARNWSMGQLDRVFNMVKEMDKTIPEDKWIRVPEKDRDNYQELFRKVRLQLRGDVYDPRMMTLLRRIRCQYRPDKAECREQTE